MAGGRACAAYGQPCAIVVSQGNMAWVGAPEAMPAIYAGMPRHDGGGALVSPGLVDCHTHLVYGGQRAHEFAMRLAGASYEQLARAGGGIVSRVRAPREAGDTAPFWSTSRRLHCLLRFG